MKSLIAVFLVPAIAFAGPRFDSVALTRDVLDMVAYKADVSRNLGEFTSQLPLERSRTEEIQTFLKKRDWATLPLPSVSAEGSRLIVSVNKKKLKLDYQINPRMALIISGREIATKGATFEELYSKAYRIVSDDRSPDTAAFIEELLFPRAYANEAVFIATVVLALATALFLGDQAIACAGNEDMMITKCKFRKNSSVIKATLSPHELVDFTCDKGKLASFKRKLTAKDQYPWRYDMVYDKSTDELTGVRVFDESRVDPKDQEKCAYKTQGVKIAEVKIKGYLCNVERFSFLPYYPVERLMRCCNDASCTKEMRTWIGENQKTAAVGTQPRSRGTSR